MAEQSGVMIGQAAAAPALAPADFGALEPVRHLKRRWPVLTGAALMIAMILLALPPGCALLSPGAYNVLAGSTIIVMAMSPPLVPNKDLLFANFAIPLIGQEQELTNLMAFTAALTRAAHAVLIGSYGAYALIKERFA